MAEMEGLYASENEHSEHLMLDPLPRGQMNAMVMESMHTKTWKFWLVAATLGLAQAGLSIFMHMGRVWLFYWLAPYPNARGLWPNFHSPLSWDFLAINTYLLASTMYLFLPLIPDLAMARDRSNGWRKKLYRILAMGFRGTEGEWTHLRTAMHIFAFAILPVMFSVHTIVSWDFAAAMRPGWNSTIFGPYFVIGALHSGIAAVAMVLVVIRSSMKNMKYL